MVSRIFLKWNKSFAHQNLSVLCAKHCLRPVSKTENSLFPARVLHSTAVRRIKDVYVSSAG